MIINPAVAFAQDAKTFGETVCSQFLSVTRKVGGNPRTRRAVIPANAGIHAQIKRSHSIGLSWVPAFSRTTLRPVSRRISACQLASTARFRTIPAASKIDRSTVVPTQAVTHLEPSERIVLEVDSDSRENDSKASRLPAVGAIRYSRVCVALCFALIASTGFALARPGKSAPEPAATAQQRQMTISPNDLAALIKSTILALQHANQTGNYSVLRDLGTPVFRERFDQAALTTAFSNLRGRHVNLTTVTMLAPNLAKQPELTALNQLHIVGYFQTQPLQVQYEMLFLQIDGVWRIEGLSVDAVPVQAMAEHFTTHTETATVPQNR
jgi:hypothetical protein